MVKRYIIFIIFMLFSTLLAQTKTIYKADDIDRMVEAFLNNKSGIIYEKKKISEKSKQIENFIQLGAFSETKPIKLIKRLKEQGFEIKLVSVIKNSQKINLLLAGPYFTQEETQIYLQQLRQIVTDAFIYRP